MIAYRLFGTRRPGSVIRGFRHAQIVSGGLLALAHGANDVQKTTGVIALALIASGSLASDADPPLWASFAVAAALAVGTYSGGWRMLRTTGARIIKMDAAQGFSAQSAGAAVILAATFLGFPISTTHAINGGVIGGGADQAGLGCPLGNRRQHRHRLASDAAGGGGDRRAAYGLMRIPGTGALGPAVVAIALLVFLVVVFVGRARRGSAMFAA